jgi:hypothetical protein
MAVMDWLEVAAYEALDSDTKKVARMEGRMPINMAAEMPEVYRLWRMCKDTGMPFWDGGFADQPRILMMEFQACERASRQVAKYAT